LVVQTLLVLWVEISLRVLDGLLDVLNGRVVDSRNWARPLKRADRGAGQGKRRARPCK
jgi:hypothetical protein